MYLHFLNFASVGACEEDVKEAWALGAEVTSGSLEQHQGSWATRWEKFKALTVAEVFGQKRVYMKKKDKTAAAQGVLKSVNVQGWKITGIKQEKNWHKDEKGAQVQRQEWISLSKWGKRLGKWNQKRKALEWHGMLWSWRSTSLSSY